MNENKQHAAFEDLLIYLKQNRGFDFTDYKRSSLRRRVCKRMDAVDIEDFEAYQDYLEVHPREFEFLFNTILINVTTFFRDRPAWDYLADEIIPKILAARGPNNNIRVWSAGCASGEEPYSVAILLAEALGLEQARRRVKIYATDVDEVALAQARQGVYSAEEVQGISEALLEKYFVRVSGGYRFNHDLRRILVFGRHDLMQDAPISRLDLLLCRNTLIYFNREAQQRIISHFHFALRETGYLFLGKAEMLLTYADLFTAQGMEYRIFSKVPAETARERSLTLAEADVYKRLDATYEASFSDALRQAAFGIGPVAQIVVDRKEMLALANTQARAEFYVDARDLGRPFRDLQISYRLLELRSLIDQVRDEGRTVCKTDVERTKADGDSQYFDVYVAPLRNQGGQWLGVVISFVDVTQRHHLHEELEHSKQELETVYEELQSTNEELETSNEELQSTVEELQTTNEELQSTNEEMETMNEELQSTNAELQTMNDELRERTLQADQASAFLRSIMASVDAGVVVIDRNFKVLLWNECAEDLWGLRPEEAEEQNLLELDIGLPVQDLVAPLQRALVENSEAEIETTELKAINRRGKTICVHVTPTRRLGTDGEVAGLVLLMEDEVV